MLSRQIWCFFIGTAAILHDAAASECVTREEFESRLLELTKSHQKEIRKLQETNEILEKRVQNLESLSPDKNDITVENDEEIYLNVNEESFEKSQDENVRKENDYSSVSKDEAKTSNKVMKTANRLTISHKSLLRGKTNKGFRKLRRGSEKESNVHTRYLVNEVTGTPAAFSVLLNSSVVTNLGTNQIIKFNKVVTNIDNVYDSRLGVFTAPISGFYAFSLAMMTRPNETQFLYVMRDGIKMFHVYATGSFYNSATKTMVLQVNKGQEVWVQTSENPGFSHNLNGYDHAAFTGFLLYASEI